MRAPDRFGLLAVGGGGRPPPELPAAAAAAADWWAGVSFGHWRPRPLCLPPVVLDRDPAGWCAAGGLGPGPRNAAALARAALLALPAGTCCPPGVVLLVAAPVAPHVWRIAGGGVATVPGGWVRRYAALPEQAPLGTWVHELAHLLLGWPDLPDSPGLMGCGGLRMPPAGPEPALALAAGWLRLLPAAAGTAVAALAPDAAIALDWHGRHLLLTRDGSRLVLHDRDRPGAPLEETPIRDAALPALAAAAPALARLASAPPGALRSRPAAG